jgi:nucleoside 2-deoxyribosyltransferase
MTNKSYFENNRLDILILGPMGSHNGADSSTLTIGKAVQQLLEEPATQELLQKTGTTNYYVHIPEEWNEQEIINGILSRLDIADLVIINLTPRDGPAGSPSPNVYYELGLVHSLGLPVIPIYQSGTNIPFYVLTTRGYIVPEFTQEFVAAELRAPVLKFLDLDDETDFSDNRISQFYDHLPIIDISAAVGLATGYYYNFVGRLLRDGSFVSAYPEKVKQLIIVRPDNVLDTYEQDLGHLKRVLEDAGFTLTTEQLPEPPGDRKGPAWISHINGIVIDLPRTIYPLKISPRLLAMQDRLDKPGMSQASIKQRNLFLRQVSEQLLDRVQRAILYHVNKEREGYRKTLLHFARINEVPGLISELATS